MSLRSSDQNYRSTRVSFGDGSELLVAKRRRKVSEEVQTEVQTDAQAAGAAVAQTRVRKKVQKTQSIGVPDFIPSKFATKTNAGIVAGALFLVIMKVTTGSYLSWGNQQYDDAGARRTAVQDENDLAAINMLSCDKCGYTLFPALGRTFRFNKFTDKCTSCGAIGSFYDRNDPTDERNQNEDGSNKVDETRAYMRKWIKADQSQAADITTQYNEETERLAAQGDLPEGLKQEIKDKKKEIADGTAIHGTGIGVGSKKKDENIEKGENKEDGEGIDEEDEKEGGGVKADEEEKEKGSQNADKEAGDKKSPDSDSDSSDGIDLL